MHPKPFMEVAGKPLLAHALERAALIADEALIVTNQDHYFLTENLLNGNAKGALRYPYLLEPKGRNTAPAIRVSCSAYSNRPMATTPVCLVPRS
jgi:mannose-1-phosphate guanylyltransferase